MSLVTPAQLVELRARAANGARSAPTESRRAVGRLWLNLLDEAERLRASLQSIADLAPECEECRDLEEPPVPKRPVTHETLFNHVLPIQFCAEHAPIRAGRLRRAESKGSGKQPEVVPYCEPNRAIEIARKALENK